MSPSSSEVSVSVPVSESSGFPVLPGQDAVELLLSRLQLVNTDQELMDKLIAWAEENTQHLTPEDFREPNIKLHYFFQHSSSLVELALRHWSSISVKVRHYGADRLQYLAQLLVAIRLIIRYREQAMERKMSTPEVDTIAVSRGWTTIADVVQALSHVEHRLVTLGSAALIDQPMTLHDFTQGESNGSFHNAFLNVRRRLDIAQQYPALFAAVGVNEQELVSLNKFLQDADVFYRSRESQSIYSKKLTELRDKVFTLTLQELEKLQLVLRAVTYGDKSLLAHIDGQYWRRLNKLSRKRRVRQKPSGSTNAESPTPAGSLTPAGSSAPVPSQTPSQPADHSIVATTLTAPSTTTISPNPSLSSQK